MISRLDVRPTQLLVVRFAIRSHMVSVDRDAGVGDTPRQIIVVGIGLGLDSVFEGKHHRSGLGVDGLYRTFYHPIRLLVMYGAVLYPNLHNVRSCVVTKVFHKTHDGWFLVAFHQHIIVAKIVETFEDNSGCVFVFVDPVLRHGQCKTMFAFSGVSQPRWLWRKASSRCCGFCL